ncbi:LPXTG-motif cell wall-anchored protein [Aeromicrobium sp. SORGH_AS981]|uniref:LPXTG cell wall anchor domain-containing protein n=1 Tax=Aeromicrobium sp. SORGH_AS_0981 TaxID=3041802 RepID=UPI0028564DF5|nr:LPXTG cell wall anchor domain-containing protein [Aeromicrobium sp. SORGH_AS_0981]MDR6117570.1 LPXTG-motif cell wall-anchored protein [Aeromicrobium sp. SORGH_AS_0981]
MRSTRLAIAGLVAGLVTLFSAGSAFAYGDEPVLTPAGGGGATVTAAPGGPFTKSGSFGGAEVQSYSATLLGQGVGSGQNTTTWTVNGTAPAEEGTYDIVFTVETNEDFNVSASGLSSAFKPAQATYTRTLKLVVGDGVAGNGAASGGGDNASGALPDTGGSNVLLLAGGAALVLAGAGVIVARRRHS